MHRILTARRHELARASPMSTYRTIVPLMRASSRAYARATVAAMEAMRPGFVAKALPATFASPEADIEVTSSASQFEVAAGLGREGTPEVGLVRDSGEQAKPYAPDGTFEGAHRMDAADCPSI